MADQFSNATEYMAKRWPLFVFIVAIILGVGKTQWVQSAQGEEMKEIKQSLSELSEIKAEWPYLKSKVDDVNKKADTANSKLDILLARSA